MPKVHQLYKETITDSKGNQKEKRETKTIRWPDEPEYVKLYLKSILFIKSLPKGYNPILISLLKRMSFAEKGQVIYLNSYLRKEIIAELNISLTHLEHAITNFVKGKILFRLGTGTYQFNAHIFGKGDWNDIAEIRSTIVFNAEGTDFITEVKKKPKKEDPNQLKMGLVEGM